MTRKEVEWIKEQIRRRKAQKKQHLEEEKRHRKLAELGEVLGSPVEEALRYGLYARHAQSDIDVYRSRLRNL